MIHEKGCKESITETIKARTNGLAVKGEEIIQLSETAIMGGIGNSLAATTLPPSTPKAILYWNF